MSVSVSSNDQCHQVIDGKSSGAAQAPFVTENSPVMWAFKGYGGRIRKIPAVVLKIMGSRARIAFLRKEADEWVSDFRTIGTSSLTPRFNQVASIDQRLALAPAPAIPTY